MINIFSIIGLVIAVSGLILIFIAKRLPVNPFVGFRIGYTYASRKIWVKYNRLAGISFFVIGLAIIFLSLYIQSLSLMITILLVLVFLNIVILSLLAAREAERELGREAFKIEEGAKYRGKEITRIEPVKPSLLRFILMILPPILSIILTIYYLPLLPEKIPVHFNVEGQPDRWESLTAFISSTLLFLIGFQFIGVIFLIVELKAPLVFYKPGLSKKDVVPVLYDIGIIVAWVMFAALIDILYYAVNKTHLLPGELFTVIVLIMIAFIFIRVIIMWQKWRKEYKKLYLAEE